MREKARKIRACLMLTCTLMTMPLVEQVMPFEGIVIVAEAASTKKVKLNKTSLKLTKGKSYTLKIANAGGKKIKWSSKKKKVATVSSKGKVTAKGKGTTYVYAKVGKKKLKCKVTVKEPAITREYTLDSGKSKSLTFSGATSKTRWKVSDPSIATLSATKGKKVTLKVKKSGRVTVTATTSGRKPYRFEVTVKGKPETLPSKPTPSQTEAPQTETNPPQTETNPPQTETPKPPVETEKPVEPSKPNSNEVYDAEIDLDSPLVGDTGRVYAYPVSGMEGYFYCIEYSSSNPAVASVDSSGNIECLAEGTTIITVRGDDGVIIDRFTITVTKSESGEKPLWSISSYYRDYYISGGDRAEFIIDSSLSAESISYRVVNVNSAIPEIVFFSSYKPSSTTIAFSFDTWIKGDYTIEFSGEGKTDRVVMHVTSSDPDWVEYNNWLSGKLANEWKADTRLDTFLKMGAWLADNRDYDASNTQFQKFYCMGGDCRAAEALFIDVATRVFDLRAYSSNTTGGGHAKAIVEIGDEKWGFDAGYVGSAGIRPFSAVNVGGQYGYYYSKSDGWIEVK